MKIFAKKSSIIVLVMLMILGMTGCGKGDKEARIGTGGEGGNYHNYGENLSELVSSETDYTIDVKATAGSAANVRLVSEGYLDMAIVQSDILSDAINGVNGFSKKYGDIHTLLGIYNESCQIIVPADSDIETIYDLRGKKISVGEKESGTFSNAKEILSGAGLSLTAIIPVYYTYEDATKALHSGDIDAFFVTASFPMKAVANLANETEIRVISIPDDIIRGIINTKDGVYVKTVIPAGTYEGQTKDATTLGVTAVLIANDNFDKDFEATVLKLIKNNNEGLQDVNMEATHDGVEESGHVLNLNMYLTLALAVGVLYLGAFLRKKISFLEKFCIPAPVIGGLIFAVISCVLYVLGIVEFTFDDTFKNICMIIFFTSVGFQANLKVLKTGGKSLIVFLVCVIVLIISQNFLAIGVSSLLHIDPLVGLCTGSIPMVGGHGTAGSFGMVLEDLGVTGAMTLCTAAATFGLIMGSLMGGPIGRRLIEKRDLLKTAENADDTVLVEDEKKHIRSVSMYAPAAYQIAIAMGVGTIVSTLLSKTGMTFPVYIGAMIVAATMRNVGEYSGKFVIHIGEINDIGGICLSFFLGIAMVTLKLWQLADLALPLFILLMSQTVLMILFSYFIVFNVMGRNYDAAILSAGTCGFGMGATPNAMANMQALTEKYSPSVKAYILVPIVGSMFADFLNSLAVTFFINIL